LRRSSNACCVSVRHDHVVDEGLRSTLPHAAPHTGPASSFGVRRRGIHWRHIANHCRNDPRRQLYDRRAAEHAIQN
jgi:hypothetical protein